MFALLHIILAFEGLGQFVLGTPHVGGLFNCNLDHHPYKSKICTTLWHSTLPDCLKLTDELSQRRTLQMYIFTGPLMFYSLLKSLLYY